MKGYYMKNIAKQKSKWNNGISILIWDGIHIFIWKCITFEGQQALYFAEITVDSDHYLKIL